MGQKLRILVIVPPCPRRTVSRSRDQSLLCVNGGRPMPGSARP